MFDKRLKQLADQLITYSVSLKAGEHVLITSAPAGAPLVKELVRSAYAVGAYPPLPLSVPELSK